MTNEANTEEPMGARILPFRDRALGKPRGRRQAPGEPPPHLHEWDVTGVTMLTNERGDVPNVRFVHWWLYLDPRIPLLEFELMHDDLDSPLILRSQYMPGESMETTIRRQALMERDNLMLATAFRES